jgi:hypothetical protein
MVRMDFCWIHVDFIPVIILMKLFLSENKMGYVVGLW